MTSRTFSSVLALSLALSLPAMAQTFVGSPGGMAPGSSVEVNLDVLETTTAAETLPPVTLIPPPSLNANVLPPPAAPAPEAAKPLPTLKIPETKAAAKPAAAPKTKTATGTVGKATPAPETPAEAEKKANPAPESKPAAVEKTIVEPAPVSAPAETKKAPPAPEVKKAAGKPEAITPPVGKAAPKRLPVKPENGVQATTTPTDEEAAKPGPATWPKARKTAVDGAIEAGTLRDAIAKAKEKMGDKKALPPASALVPSPDVPRGEPKPNAIDGALKAAVLKDAETKAAEIRNARNPKPAETPATAATAPTTAASTSAKPAATGSSATAPASAAASVPAQPAATAANAPAAASPTPAASQAPPAAPVEKPQNLRLAFEGGSSDIKPEYAAQIDSVIAWLQKNETARLQIEAYASSPDGQTNMARRVSLSRALAIRSYLIDHNVRSTRIDVRAKGDATTEQPLDRADLIISQ